MLPLPATFAGLMASSRCGMLRCCQSRNTSGKPSMTGARQRGRLTSLQPTADGSLGSVAGGFWTYGIGSGALSERVIDPGRAEIVDRLGCRIR